jgi:dTDP-4-amino-4,6-dideoxygalactose transaminase
MSNICAGIGRGQMKVLPKRVEQKRAIYERYAENLKDLPLTFQPENSKGESNRWLSVILLEKDCGVTAMQVLDALAADNIEGRPVWKPMHAQPVYASTKFVAVEDESVSLDLFGRSVCLPSDTKLTFADVDRICNMIKSLF